MAVKRGKSQARRSGGGNASLPGWAWMIIGVLLTIVVVVAAPKLLRSDGEDGFFRPRPNPDARPAPATSGADDSVAAETPAPAVRPAAPAAEPEAAETTYDFYTLLPGQEVAMTDAELAASARAEQQRQQVLLDQARKAGQQPEPVATPNPDAADPAPVAEAQPKPAATPAAPAARSPAAPAVAADGARYILQAGSFGSSSDADALKARIALLGLSARVEPAQIDGRTMYRVRMGPYATASELAEAKQKLGNGGLPALAIRAQ
ncbi:MULTISPECIES: SPOR domain-containing protein [unclassified Luteimonas]|uniref:SPOR domain-containing protein n=1 Tax=unclassified Luteimonas TaxID=2629088 RepID=UPI001600C4A1|nr:SPOR domain-containing protein [Luteimonas sp. MC1825]MBB1473122.1 SPOR domain-containing protein [Luteimonas sp. MC1782]MBB6598174.1 SPOR domain-containing protein [Luteimonas sp. MC1825]QOC88400.1 SPOR domain-containing protein [Luteimonas sp. MC1825]